MKVLFIGRFQPFHRGHLQVITNAARDFDEVIIGIGSSQYGNKLDNPFTSDERKLMIERSLDNSGVKNYNIILIPDIHNPPKWVDHVLSIVSDFEIVITNNALTKRLFLEKGYEVKETPLFNNEDFSGEEIRKRMINEEHWSDCVPKEVEEIINEIDGVKRLKELSKN